MRPPLMASQGRRAAELYRKAHLHAGGRLLPLQAINQEHRAAGLFKVHCGQKKNISADRV